MNQQQYPMQPMANQMAQHGRYGDSMMVHMNPIEVQGIAALSPTGQLTRNPVTGQPEAFLPFLAPLLGSMFGKAVLAKSIPFLAGNSALAGAIGSGLATTAAIDTDGCFAKVFSISIDEIFSPPEIIISFDLSCIFT